MTTLEGHDPTAMVMAITDAARMVIVDARQGEHDPSSLSLFIEVSGVDGGVYTYDMWFQALRDAGPSDTVQHYDDLAVVIAASSVEQMLGATLDVSDTGLVVINPNVPPKPKDAITVPTSDLSSALELAVLAVLESDVNPQIAMHGGRADLIAVDEDKVAYLRLSGGCQGCGLAAVTLSQGITVAIKEAVPEITEIIDVTAHGEGSNPYFEAAKK